MHSRCMSNGLNAFRDGFGVTPCTTSVLSCLAPAVFRSLGGTSRRLRRGQFDGPLRSASHVAGLHATVSTTPIALPSNQSPPKHTSSTVSPRNNRFFDARVSLLDPYLPLELRSKDWLENLAHFEGIRPIHTLPKLLSEVQRSRPHYLSFLSYIGLLQGRWAALLWLVKAVVGTDQPALAVTNDKPFYQMPWDTDISLDELTSTSNPPYKIITESPQNLTPFSLEQSTKSYKMNWQGKPADSDNDLIGHIWQCVGSLILAAADSGAEESTEIMSHVHQILAYMHHYDIIPTSLYNYKPAKDYTALQRPPTLHLLSSRIWTILSDSAWKAHEKEIIAEAAQVGAKYVYKGHELPGAEYTPRLRQLDPATWMELVLWSCVEGGWIGTAAWIVNRMLHRKDQPNWTTVSWSTLRSSAIQEGPESNSSDWQSPKTRYIRVAGTFEGYSDGPPFVEMRSRTVSTEVIEALVDGFACAVGSSAETKINIPTQKTIDAINDCKELLKDSREESALEPLWNMIMVRMVEFGDVQAESNPTLLNSVVKLAPPYHGGSQSLASVGIWQNILQMYIHLADTQRAKNAIRKLQSFNNTDRAMISAKSRRRPPETRTKGFLDPSQDQKSLFLGESENDQSVGWKAPEVPEPLLADFLDLLTSEKSYDLGNQMLYSRSGSGEPIIPLTLYSSTFLQPALLRFAQATGNNTLLIEVTKKLATPLSIPVMRALLHCQIGLEEWDAVEDLLEYIKTVKKGRVTAEDIMMVARSILQLQRHQALDASNEASIKRAQKILVNILKGAYDASSDLSQPRDYSQRRLLNQIARILTSVPGITNKVAAQLARAKGQAHAATRVPTLAFNLLLDKVVEIRGTFAGKELWDMWCRLPASNDQTTEADMLPLDINLDPQGKEKIVTPTVQTVGIILAPLISERIKQAQKSWPDGVMPEEESQRKFELESKLQMLDWGVDMYRRMGITDKEIGSRIPGYFE